MVLVGGQALVAVAPLLAHGVRAQGPPVQASQGLRLRARSRTAPWPCKPTPRSSSPRQPTTSARCPPPLSSPPTPRPRAPPRRPRRAFASARRATKDSLLRLLPPLACAAPPLSTARRTRRPPHLRRPQPAAQDPRFHGRPGPRPPPVFTPPLPILGHFLGRAA